MLLGHHDFNATHQLAMLNNFEAKNPAAMSTCSALHNDGQRSHRTLEVTQRKHQKMSCQVARSRTIQQISQHSTWISPSQRSAIKRSESEASRKTHHKVFAKRRSATRLNSRCDQHPLQYGQHQWQTDRLFGQHIVLRRDLKSLCKRWPWANLLFSS